jgi:biotin-(acetyl-CoA carboxylase) ligase
MQNRPLSLPPAFRAVAADANRAPVTVAVAMAADGADPGTFVWAPREDVADCAVVLAPEEALATALLAAYATMVAAGDALGALIPPKMPVAFGWPDRILLNGAMAGGIRLAAPQGAPADAVPDWIVTGLTLARTAASDDEPGRDPSRTSLAAEGCGDLTAAEILEAFARHFLFWINRWQEDGFAPLQAAWLGRAAGYGAQNATMEIAGPWAGRRLLSMDTDGSVRFAENGREIRRPLADILAGPTWSL